MKKAQRSSIVLMLSSVVVAPLFFLVGTLPVGAAPLEPVRAAAAAQSSELSNVGQWLTQFESGGCDGGAYLALADGSSELSTFETALASGATVDRGTGMVQSLPNHGVNIVVYSLAGTALPHSFVTVHIDAEALQVLDVVGFVGYDAGNNQVHGLVIENGVVTYDELYPATYGPDATTAGWLCCFGHCMEAHGFPDWVWKLIGAVCGVTCAAAPVVGPLPCAACAAGAAGLAGSEVMFCVLYAFDLDHTAGACASETNCR